jgi:hypothetical protein
MVGCLFFGWSLFDGSRPSAQRLFSKEQIMGTSLQQSGRRFVLFVAAMAGVSIPATSSPAADEPAKADVTEAEVNAAQQAWCDGLVEIGKIHQTGGDYKAAASRYIDDLYDYREGKVFFKPTLAFGKNTFRSTKEGALSYFIGGDKNFPDDAGFALKHWVKVRYDNNAAENGIQIHGAVALTMGNVYFSNSIGEEIMVDKTFVFRRCRDGKLRLCAHKSALPFAPSK